jgi:hypothetical protein
LDMDILFVLSGVGLVYEHSVSADEMACREPIRF